MAKKKYNGSNGDSENGGNGLPPDPRVLKFLAELVKGQAGIARALHQMEERHTREMKRMEERSTKSFRMLFKVSMDSHKDIQYLKKRVGRIEFDVSTIKTDVSDLKVRLTRVEGRLDGNGPPRSEPRAN